MHHHLRCLFRWFHRGVGHAVDKSDRSERPDLLTVTDKKRHVSQARIQGELRSRGKAKNTVVQRVYTDKRLNTEANMPSRWSIFACMTFLLATAVACGNDACTHEASDLGSDRAAEAEC